jgi:hypothetical protein
MISSFATFGTHCTKRMCFSNLNAAVSPSVSGGGHAAWNIKHKVPVFNLQPKQVAFMLSIVAKRKNSLNQT